MVYFKLLTKTLYIFYNFRQNLNSDFTGSTPGSSEKSSLPYGMQKI